ncbi:MAG: VCBS repeat-containing protein [Verrucomicrobiota bacterium]
MKPSKTAAFLSTAYIALLTACQPNINDRDKSHSRSLEENPSTIGIERFQSRPIGKPVVGMPWITDLHLVDLDQDGLKDIVACEGKLNQVSWIRQHPIGQFTERIIGKAIAGPAHIEHADLDSDGDIDLLIAGMGLVTPSNDPIGSVVVLENDGKENFSNRALLEKVPRVTHVEAGDLDGDGDLDLSVGQFGYYEGEIQWLENQGDWQFSRHSLSYLEGAIHTPITDFDQDGDQDIVALLSQDWEEIHLFQNLGQGEFKNKVAYGSTNKDFGSSGLTVDDLDQDGDIDIVYTNGDGFDYSVPGSRSWHGVQWLENDGKGNFEYKPIGEQAGSYSPLPIDIDADGDKDIIVASGFNDWSNSDSASLVCFENLGNEQFAKRILAHQPTHLVVVDAADMDNDGDLDLVSGGFHFYPPYDKLSRITLWENL